MSVEEAPGEEAKAVPKQLPKPPSNAAEVPVTVEEAPGEEAKAIKSSYRKFP